MEKEKEFSQEELDKVVGGASEENRRGDPVYCPYCSACCTSPRALKDHIRSAHSGRFYRE